jgi:lysyl-tRNA synthetase, class II
VEQKTLQQLREVRIQKLNKLKSVGINPYPSKTPEFEPTSTAKIKKPDEQVAIVGRVMAMRGHGKIFFMDLFDGEDKMQCFFEENTLHDKIKFIELFDIGDFLHVAGKLFMTQAGELTIRVENFTLLSKSIRPLPDKFHGLQNEEERYRKRYLDFIFNKDAREKIKIRAKVVTAIREFMNDHGFLEVETPVLENSASGALAKPFKTHINAYDLDMYLRICMGELWQKKMMVAQFGKTYEIGRAYRNEGVDREHNPEFTMMEYYWSFADYEKNMDFQEKLIAEVVFKTFGDYEIKNGENIVNFRPIYPRVTYRDLFQEKLQIDIDSMTASECFEYARTNKVDVKKEWGKGKLLDEIYKDKIRPHIIQPMFLIDHPVELKPLAKRGKNPNYVESFQLLACGFELSNNYSELNDPMDQESRFDEQQEVKKHSDEEIMEADESFVEALEHGMPPTSGAGIGIDRLVALLTNSHTLRETIAFPLMKPEKNTN